ncbi:nucleotide sugar dehydrogenase [Actinomyces israelii]|uniref:nucleotide sugar dehydrogenase n=1 Tax=Actinomyces israelii TaxID=1659 RepID=UPI000A601463|nr:nucleotide sugar dehydrogenase [Actinomyces israelii]
MMVRSRADRLLDGGAALAVVGLGYVGLPLAVAFSRRARVIGYDSNEEKVSAYRSGLDPTAEVGDEALRACAVDFTSDATRLDEASFFVIAVPTPVNLDKTPDLAPVTSVSETVGRHLKEGDTVVYESTVYPGVTEDVCIPILERVSGLRCPQDFKVGYSPERINPGDRVHRLESIKKIVSGIDSRALDEIADVYSLVIDAGIHRASSIKVAEAAKVVENSQRDINIAFMNELAVVFDLMGIDTSEVVEAMNTKWNALGFRPGLVGGHCIGVDPYYFTYEAEKLGYHSQIILSGRKVNDAMGEFVADAAIREMVRAGHAPSRAGVAILGITFKENCPDVRNSKVADIIRRLGQYGIVPRVCDPAADAADARRVHGVDLVPLAELGGLDCLIVAVAHDEFRRMTSADYKRLFRPSRDEERVLVDVKSILRKEDFSSYRYWRL